MQGRSLLHTSGLTCVSLDAICACTCNDGHNNRPALSYFNKLRAIKNITLSLDGTTCMNLPQQDPATPQQTLEGKRGEGRIQETSHQCMHAAAT
ncbi:hypothetical protein EJ02DRAFT_456648 [Clathrospora elynae]|uniref:Secreted protein n=1 Tax=Clathrospora elynae TaxID=706981 RepID=A0A6A5SJI4_9PLEO|nr:hypothetical protein EJ02DRAFT_456648 [Clathrospora elynae]